VPADVAAPDYNRPPTRQLGHQTSRLRIVSDDDVTRSDERAELDRVGIERPLVDLPLRRAQLRAITCFAVQRVVKALGDAKKLGGPVNDHPAGVDAEAARIAEQRAEHFGDTSAGSGRVEIPDDARAESFTEALRDGHRLGHALLADDGRIAI